MLHSVISRIVTKRLKRNDRILATTETNPTGDPKNMSRAQVLRDLEAVANDEKKALKKALKKVIKIKEKPNAVKTDKDW